MGCRGESTVLRAKEQHAGLGKLLLSQALVFSGVKGDDNLLLFIVVRTRGPHSACRPAEHRKDFFPYVLAV